MESNYKSPKRLIEEAKKLINESELRDDFPSDDDLPQENDYADTPGNVGGGLKVPRFNAN